MKRSKWLFETIIKDCKTNGYVTRLAVLGVFDTMDVKWKYYVISYYKDNHNDYKTSSDLCKSVGQVITLDNVEKLFKEYSSLEEGQAFVESFKIKWETGSNSTLEEKRDKKLNDLLDD